MLLTAKRTELAPETFVAAEGDIFARFDAATQDSGNVAFGVRVGEHRFFVKTAGSSSDTVPLLPHDERVKLLRNAIRLNRTFSHRVLPALRNVVESPDGPLLVYEWVDGETLGAPASRQRFRSLPMPRALSALDAIFDLHRKLAAARWVAADFYDGCLVYDFEAARIHVVDLDNYHRGPFVNEMGRMFGSTRFMAPEEFQLGARIDERTTVFNMGRAVFELLADASDPGTCRGSAAQVGVAERACQQAANDRFGSMAEFHDAWQAAHP